MRLHDLALLNLRRRKAKAIFVLLGLSVGVATLVSLITVAQGLSAEIEHKLERFGANILVTPQNESLSLSYAGLDLGGVTFSRRELKQDDLKAIAGIKNAANVAAVGPMLLDAVRINGHKALLAGMEFETAYILKPWWKVTGKMPQGDQILLGSQAARVLGLDQGATVPLGDRQLVVSGVLAPTGGPEDGLVLTPLATAQAVLNRPGQISLAEVAALCKDCPVDDMVAQIGQVLPGAQVTAIQSVVKGRMNALAHFQRFALGVSLLVALVGALVVLVTMMASVRERTREIGIFRAIGFRSGAIMRVVLTEAGILSLLAGVLGTGLGLLAAAVALPWFSTEGAAHLSPDPALMAGALALSLSIGLLAALPPARLAARQDPAEALRSL